MHMVTYLKISSYSWYYRNFLKIGYFMKIQFK